MQLRDQVSIGVPDLEAARPFYDSIMNALGAIKVYDRPNALGYGARYTRDDTESTFQAVYLDPCFLHSRHHNASIYSL